MPASPTSSVLQAESAAGTLTCEATEESGVGQWAAGPYRLDDGRTLTVAGDGTATITA